MRLQQTFIIKGCYVIWLFFILGIGFKIVLALNPGTPSTDFIIIIIGLIVIALLPYIIWLTLRPIKYLQRKTTNKSAAFRVIIRQPIPYLTSFLYFIVLLSLLGILLTYAIFTPSKHSSLEMKSAYFILAIPSFIKYIIIFSFPGFILFHFLYEKVRKYRGCILLFSEEALLIRGKITKMKILVSQIRNIICIDEKDLQGGLKLNLVIYIVQKSSKVIRLTLQDYSYAEEFMEKLTNYSNINFKFYDFDSTEFESE
jgi:hypothetical protein